MLPNQANVPPLVLLVIAAGMASGFLDQQVLAQTKPINVEIKRGTQPRLDVHGDPLPEGALARLGTVRMRHGCAISGAVFSGDGTSIVASDYCSGVHVWDIGGGKEIRRFLGTRYYCNCLALSPNGRILAVALGDLTVRLCDPSTGRDLGSLPPDSDRVHDMVFSHDGSLLATGTGKKVVKIWNVATRRVVRELTFPVHVWNLAFSADDKLLACSADDYSCRLWHLAQVNEIRHFKDGPGGTCTLRAAFAPHGGPLAISGYQDRSIRLFTADGRKEIRRLHEEAAKVNSMKPREWWDQTLLTFSPSGKMLAASRGLGRIDLWDVASGEKLRTFVAGDAYREPRFLSFSPDGSKFTSADGNILRVWDVSQGKEILSPTGHGAPLSSVAISPSGDTVVTAGLDGVAHLWERDSGKHLFRLEEHRSGRPQVSFSSGGQRVLDWVELDRTLRIWNAKTGKIIQRLEAPGAKAYWSSIAEDGTAALSVEPGRAVRLHDLTTGRVMRELAGASWSTFAGFLSSTGAQIVSYDGARAFLMNAAAGTKLGQVEIRGVTSGACSSSMQYPWLALGADGRWLAAAVGESLFSQTPTQVAVVDTVEARELRRFGKTIGKYPAALFAAALSRDGKTVLTVHGNQPDEQVITLWETETGQERGSFVGHVGRIRNVAISLNGRYVVTGADDTTALVWDATRPRARNPAIPRDAAVLDLSAHFKNLAGADAEQAYASMWALIDVPEKTVSFLGDQVNFHRIADVKMIQRWIRDLESNKFAEREMAFQELGHILDQAAPFLKKAVKNVPTVEARRRIDLLLRRKSAGFSGKELQEFRVIEILERIAGAGADDRHQRAAVALLKRRAHGAPEATLAREADAALKRLNR